MLDKLPENIAFLDNTPADFKQDFIKRATRIKLPAKTTISDALSCAGKNNPNKTPVVCSQQTS